MARIVRKRKRGFVVDELWWSRVQRRRNLVLGMPLVIGRRHQTPNSDLDLSHTCRRRHEGFTAP